MGVDEILLKDAIDGKDLDREGCVEIVREGEKPVYLNFGNYIHERANGRGIFGENCRVYFVQLGDSRGKLGIKQRVWMGNYCKSENNVSANKPLEKVSKINYNLPNLTCDEGAGSGEQLMRGKDE